MKSYEELCDERKLANDEIERRFAEAVDELRKACPHPKRTRFLYAGPCRLTNHHCWVRLCENCGARVEEQRGDKPIDSVPGEVY